jgi:hypothetical protein
MVERKTETQTVPKQLTFEDYVEKWFFRTFRRKGRLRCQGIGHDLKHGQFEVNFVFGKDGWKVTEVKDLNTGVEGIPEVVEVEMFRCFAAYKAKYLAAKGRPGTKSKCFSAPPGEGEKKFTVNRET